MDPVTHTLFGYSFARAGLERRGPLATATLVVGANLPDVDAVTYFMGDAMSLWLRRGVTHGVLALALWPLILTGGMLLWARLRAGPPGERPVAGFARLLPLACLAVWSHPLLDFLNNYGMRWLMPFSGTWYYGDTLYIIDPWVLLTLALGVTLVGLGRRDGLVQDRGRPARIALALTTAYILVMTWGNVAGRSIVRGEAIARGIEPIALMVSPVPIDPFHRRVVVEGPGAYYVADLAWLPSPALTWTSGPIPKYPPSPAATLATRGPASRRFLGWARFPYFVEEGPVVYLGDLRYRDDPRGGGFGSLRVADSAPADE